MVRSPLSSGFDGDDAEADVVGAARRFVSQTKRGTAE
jgi:hypothetical protein